MKKVMAIGASNSRQSINRTFADWAANQLDEVEVSSLDLNDFEMPIYGIDRENQSGIPDQAYAFKSRIREADAIILSLAEHNGSYTAAFKNITDWVSRIERGTWSNKPVLLLATSPGPRGGIGVLTAAKTAFPYQAADVVGSFSLPAFNQNFRREEGITDVKLKGAFLSELNKLNDILKRSSENVSV